MTPQELVALGPYFREGERFLNGTVIDWNTIDYQTMFWVVQLRTSLDAPISLIRGAHPNRPSAVDACCPSVPLAQVFMALTRLQLCSWGIYSGCSFHVDTREFRYLPSRWLAVKEAEEHALISSGLRELITSRRDGWLYLSYAHPRAFEAVALVCRLAESKRATPEAV